MAVVKGRSILKTSSRYFLFFQQLGSFQGQRGGISMTKGIFSIYFPLSKLYTFCYLLLLHLVTHQNQHHWFKQVTEFNLAKPLILPTCLTTVPACSLDDLLPVPIWYLCNVKEKLTIQLSPKKLEVLWNHKVFKCVENQNGHHLQKHCCCHLQLICNEMRRVNSHHWY